MALGATAVTDWTSQKLANVSLSSNENYLWPDSEGKPTILTTGGTGGYLTQTGGPPTWTASFLNPDTTVRTGELFPNTLGGTVLVNTSADSLLAVIFAPGANPVVTTVATGLNGLRCAHCIATATSGVVTLHLSFGFRGTDGGEYIGYATRSGSSAWVVAARPTGSAAVTGTAVYATNATNGVVYMNYGLTQGASTLAMWNGVFPGTVTNLDGGSYGPICSYNGTFYYSCLRDRTGYTTDIRAFSPVSQSATSVAVLPAVAGGPTATHGIRAAMGADAKIRLAVADIALGTIYYIKLADASLGKAATIGTGASADLRGFMFDPNGVPIILYRKSQTDAYVAYPTEKVDTDGNGRVDLMDLAFNNSTTDGVTVLDPALDLAPTVKDSANRFKIQFPVLATPAVTTSTSLKNTAKNLNYRVEISTNLVTWTAPTAATFKFTVSGAANAKVATGVFSDPVPGTTPAKFARVIVERITDNF